MHRELQDLVFCEVLPSGKVAGPTTLRFVFSLVAVGRRSRADIGSMRSLFPTMTAKMEAQ